MEAVVRSFRATSNSVGDERTAHLRVSVPAQCTAGLIYGNSERAAAAYREHGDDAAKRPAHDAGPFHVNERHSAQIVERREYIIGLRLQPRNDRPLVVAGIRRSVGFTV